MLVKYVYLQLLVLVSGTQSLVCITVGRHFPTVNSCMARYFTLFFVTVKQLCGLVA